MEGNCSSITFMITAVANIIAANLNTGEIVLLAAYLVQLSDTLAAIAAQREACEEKKENGNNDLPV